MRTKKDATPAQTINSMLTLQLALSPFFKKHKLPALAVVHTNKAVFLTGPCGQTICKIIYTGAATIPISDYPVIYDATIAFITNNIKKLHKLFTLKMNAKDIVKLKLDNHYYDTKGGSRGPYITFNSSAAKKHPLYNKYLYTVYADGSFDFNPSNITKVKGIRDMADSIEASLPAILDLIKTIQNTQDSQAEINDIIADLSACSM